MLIDYIHYFNFVFSLKAWNCQKTIPSNMFLFTLFTPDIFIANCKTLLGHMRVGGSKWGNDGYNWGNNLIPKLLPTSATMINLGDAHVRVPQQGTFNPDQSYLYCSSCNTPHTHTFWKFLVFFLSWIGGKTLLYNSHVCVNTCVCTLERWGESPLQMFESGLFTITTCLPLSWFLGRTTQLS